MFNTKIFILLACTLAIAMASQHGIDVMTGAPIHLEGEALKEAEHDLQVSLNNLASTDGLHLELSKIISGTVQVVSGTMTRMNVQLINTDGGAVMNCNVAIWSRPWMPNGIQTTLKCAQLAVTESHHA